MIDVYDNLIGSDLSDNIENNILNDTFPFFYRNITVDQNHYDDLKYKKDIKDGPQLTHNFCNHNSISNHFNVVEPLINEMIKILNYNKLITFTRIKANLKMNNNNLNKDFYNTPHIDKSEDYTNVENAALYFVNNTDGDMFFFNNIEDQKVIKRVSPKKGRFIVFKNNLYHSGQHPIDSKVRCTINFNF